ncbi:MAG TPA: hypothetical protein VNA24_06495 [Hyalangium sp.]|nr:hypothetical protein [Hyalangium sp.]
MTPGLGPMDLAGLEALGSKKAYDKFLSAARAIDSGLVEECRADVALAYHSAKRGLESLLSQDVPLSRLPDIKMDELRTLPELAQGVVFAVLQWHHQLEAASFGPLFEQAQRLRRKLLKSADALAETGLLPEADAEAVRHLSRHDVIGTCMAFSELLRRNEARVVGRSPLTVADLDEVDQTITQLRALLSPREGARGEPSLPSLVEAAQIRDRFWTLLKQRHDLLWRCGAWLYGREVDSRVPPLQAEYTLLPKPKPVPSALALVPPRPVVVTPPPERSSPMRTLQRKIRALVSVSIGRSAR